MSEHTPVLLRLHQKTRRLDVQFENGKTFSMSCEYLRVHSPSAEVMGHGHGTLQTGKEDVNIHAIVPIGNYAVKLEFDDNHNSGIFSWDYLYKLGENQAGYWEHYLQCLARAGHARRNSQL